MFRIFASAILYLGLWHFYSHYPLLSDGKYFYDRFDYLDFRDTKYFKALPFLTHKDDLPLGGPGVKYAFRINDSMLRVPCPSGSGDGIFAISPFSSSENTRFYLPK
ncbi:MAG TPA: hypothetical protein VJC03_02175, partial [bacterium]|nr:hypothetical protein [bacterium]